MEESYIPLKIFQTWYNKNVLSSEINELTNDVKTKNPEFEYFLFDIDDCENFIQKYFDNNVLCTYNALIPLAYKNHLWSLCVLYIQGGIYLDINLKCVNNFKLYSLTYKEHFAVDTKLNEYPNEIHKGICSNIMCCKSNNPVILRAIQQIVENVKTNFYGESPLDPTGSVLLGTFFSDDQKENMDIKRIKDHRGDGFGINNQLIIEFLNIPDSSTYHYISDWHTKNIYKQKAFTNITHHRRHHRQRVRCLPPALQYVQPISDPRSLLKNNDNEIIYVTAFKDIGRALWNTFRRGNDEYFNCFILLSNNFNPRYKLIVFVDNEIKAHLLSKNKFNDNIIFYNFDDVDSFYKKYLQKETEILNSEIFRRKVASNRLYNNPETWCAKYNLINHSKINFIKHVKTLYLNYKYYAWIDFGFVKNGDLNVIPKSINPDKVQNKITYQYKYLTLRIDANEILKSNNDYIAGGAFVIPNEKVEWFEKKYENKLNEWYLNYIADDDQSLVLQLYFDNKDIFNLIQDYNACSLFKHLC